MTRALTIRLDPERHLKLRLASACLGKSAQQIVTGQLDLLFDRLPSVRDAADAIARTHNRNAEKDDV